MEQQTSKQDLHPYVQYLLQQREKELSLPPQLTMPKEISVRKRTQQLSRAIR